MDVVGRFVDWDVLFCFLFLLYSVCVLEIMNKYRKDCFKLCDVVFKIGDEYILIYRVVLVVCSLYFYVMFMSDLVES